MENDEQPLTIANDHPERKWSFCRPYLVRYNPAGTYYLRISVNGDIVRKSLKTTSLTIALRKLPAELEKERGRSKASEEKSMSDHWRVYFSKIKASGIKPRSIKYREETWGMIQRTWPGFAGSQAHSVSKSDCEHWASRVRGSKSATRFNGCLETLRGIFRAAIDAGSCVADPTGSIERASVPIMAPELPTQQEFQAILHQLDGHPRKNPAAFVCRLLAYTGLRINEARNLDRQDVDLKNGWLLARVTKNGEPRRIPIIKEARPVLAEFVNGAEVIDPRKALRTASNRKLTPHDLRHLFATRCIEAGVDVRTVAGWLGHRDGGALLLKRYAHLRDEHSQKMAKKVRFI